jgi:hypothetical protein
MCRTPAKPAFASTFAAAPAVGHMCRRDDDAAFSVSYANFGRLERATVPVLVEKILGGVHVALDAMPDRDYENWGGRRGPRLAPPLGAET